MSKHHLHPNSVEAEGLRIAYRELGKGPPVLLLHGWPTSSYTLVYPEFSDAVLAFLKACSEPESRRFLTSPEGLEAAMRLGLAEDSELDEEVLAAVREPFADEDARTALADAGKGLEPGNFEEIARWLPSISVPVRVVYGAQDRILPDIATTVERFARDVPRTEITALADCGHFLQEEEPTEIGELLAEFFAR